MKKILLTAVVLLGFGSVMFAQSKEAKKATRSLIPVSLNTVQQEKNAKQIALKKAAAKELIAPASANREVVKPATSTPAKKD